ncbi:response regulator [Aridibaculum aurantiacum]|uniref:response regulator n=1 Tax=Aridibaculum aurantiacum TaxID=2810307 RepID=UPI001A979E4A|nr:response regulator [Aridibaculum aurantiacum]
MDNSTRLVLLAEDNNEEYVGFLRAVSKQPGIEVMRLDDGYSLLNMLQTAIEPYAIFLDVNLRYKDGLSTLREIRDMKRFNQVPVIMLSKEVYPPNIEIAYELGATYFIKKCFAGQAFADIFDRILSSSYFNQVKQPPLQEFVIES